MATTAKGHIEQLPSGSYRVKVYGARPRSPGKKPPVRDLPRRDIGHDRARPPAEGSRRARRPERDALFGRVLDVYLEVTELATTRVTHESCIRRIIRPVLGEVKARKIGPD